MIMDDGCMYKCVLYFVTKTNIPSPTPAHNTKHLHIQICIIEAYSFANTHTLTLSLTHTHLYAPDSPRITLKFKEHKHCNTVTPYR